MKMFRAFALVAAACAASLLFGVGPAAAHDDGFVGVQVGPIGLGLDVDDDWDDYDCGRYDRCDNGCDHCWWGHHWRNYYYDDCRGGCDDCRGAYWDDG